MSKFFNKLRQVSFLLFTTFILLNISSCGDDEEVVPLLPSVDFTVSSEDSFEIDELKTMINVDEGVIIEFDFNLTTFAGFKAFTVTGLSEPLVFTPASLGIGDSEESVNISDVPLQFTGSGERIVSFTVTDVLDRDIIRRLTVIIATEDSRSVQGVSLMAPLADDPSTAQDERTSDTWFSANLGTTLTSAAIVAGSEQSKDVDFGFYYQDDQVYLSSPASFSPTQYDLSSTGQNWATRNTVTFRTVSVTESNFFQLNTAFSIEKAFLEGEDIDDAGVISGLEAGDFIGFRTDSSKDGGPAYGIIFIKSVTPSNDSPATLTFDARLQ